MREVLVNLPGGGSHWFDIPAHSDDRPRRDCCPWSEIEDHALRAIVPTLGIAAALAWAGRSKASIYARCARHGIKTTPRHLRKLADRKGRVA